MADVSSTTTSSDIGGVILAGGRARRLGGMDKGLLDLCGRPMIVHSMRALAPQVRPLFISSNRNLERYRALGHEVIEDHFGAFEGPLAGLWRALEATPTPLLASLPCDAPLAPADFVARLREHFTPGQALAAIAHDGERLQPLFGLFSREVLPGLAAFLQGGGRKVHDWVTSLEPVRVDFSDCAQAFRNVNTPEDLEAIRKLMGCQTKP